MEYLHKFARPVTAVEWTGENISEITKFAGYARFGEGTCFINDKTLVKGDLLVLIPITEELAVISKSEFEKLFYNIAGRDEQELNQAAMVSFVSSLLITPATRDLLDSVLLIIATMNKFRDEAINKGLKGAVRHIKLVSNCDASGNAVYGNRSRLKKSLFTLVRLLEAANIETTLKHKLFSKFWSMEFELKI